MRYMGFVLVLSWLMAIVAPANANMGHTDLSKKVISDYAKVVYQTYLKTYDDAVAMDKSIQLFLETPNSDTLKNAQTAWLKARESYGQTEAFRFYEGPIDRVDPVTGKKGPEARLNSWPLNEAYIDYVRGNPNAGIINDFSVPITANTIINRNQYEDEADVITGYHAVEFMLWGQDFNNNGPGIRPLSDFIPGTKTNDRRRDYLQAISSILVNDLRHLVDEWKPDTDNYARQFIKEDVAQGLTKILTGMITLAGFELAAERMGTALDSGDQEDEHSCFSDNTHNDFIDNAKGIKNAYFGTFNGVTTEKSLDDLLTKVAPNLSEKIRRQFEMTEASLSVIQSPIDQVLAKPKDHIDRKQMEFAVQALLVQADLLKEAGKVLGLNIHAHHVHHH